MSHVERLKIAVSDLNDLKKAAHMLGLEFVEGQTTYRWWGHSVGDYPLPEGFTEEELGKCHHAIRIPNDPRAYQIGVVQKNGKWVLLYDFYNGGFGLEEKIGAGAGKLKQAYGVVVTQRQAQQQGFHCTYRYDAEKHKYLMKLVKATA